MQVGDRVRICNLQAPFRYGALATVEIVENDSYGLAYIRFDAMERITTSTNPNDLTRRWWIEKEYLEVVDSDESNGVTAQEESSPEYVVMDEEIPAPTEAAYASEVTASEVYRRLESSMNRASNELSQRLRARREAATPVWPDPGYGDSSPTAPLGYDEPEEASQESSVAVYEPRSSDR
jgi:hypothetical protein